jgi:sugar-specific transcriptional regulator TrmB
MTPKTAREINSTTLGLTKNESAIYLFLLKHGASTTGAIIKETGIANSRVYESLRTLVNQGLVTYSVHKDGKRFCASDPRTFIEHAEERTKKLQETVPILLALKNTAHDETTTAVYEGFSGFKVAFKKIIDDCPAGGTIRILAFSQQLYAEQSLRTFLKNMNQKSALKRQKLLVLVDESVRTTLGKDRSAEKYTTVRYLPKGTVSPAAIDVFDDYTYIILWDERPFVFMIKNKRIAASFTAYFNALWTTAKK